MLRAYLCHLMMIVVIACATNASANTNVWLTDPSNGVKLWSPQQAAGESVAWYGPKASADGPGLAIWSVAGTETERAAGIWKHGRLDTYGVWQHHEGDRYEGQWKHGKKHGFGVYRWPDGRHFRGRYQNGKRDDGIVYQADGTSQKRKIPTAKQRENSFKAETAAMKARTIATDAQRQMTEKRP